MRIEAIAPTRIDLAGGTLDIYPLYLFLEGGLTINMAIDLMAQVRLETRSDRGVRIFSRDTGLALWAPDVASLPQDWELSLLARAVRFYPPRTGVTITTHNLSPHGSGLGASSALLIALSGALGALNGSRISNEQIIEFAANLEAQVIGIPTGKQDYYAAVYGGVNAIWFGTGGNRVERLVTDEGVIAALERRVILTFTGESRFSGTSNWNMLKAFIDNLNHTQDRMRAIKATAESMREALLSADLERFTWLMAEEWRNRKQLAEGVTTPHIEQLIAAAAEAGARASKICGAGGGGCMISIAGEGQREAVIRALEAHGARHIPYRVARRGLTLRRGQRLEAPRRPVAS